MMKTVLRGVLTLLFSASFCADAQSVARPYSLSPGLQLSRLSDSAISRTYLLAVKDPIHFRDILQSNRIHHQVQRSLLNGRLLSVDIYARDLEFLLRIPGLITYADVLRVPREETIINGFDPSVNNINEVRSKFPHINGDKIVVSVKEEQYDSTDMDFRGRHVPSPVSSRRITSHATLMATIIGGAGNISEMSRGVAWKSMVTSSGFAGLLPDEDSMYRNNRISVQNHSYGTGIENYYGVDAAAYDLSAINNRNLLHVFSAGNQGTSSPAFGYYAGIAGYANLSGSFKMSKNSISVGATDAYSKIEDLSSRGPTYDGRIKPEVVAFGIDGSSGAAAIVSGVAALIQDAYNSQFAQLPPSTLTRAVLLNTAHDVGTKGPDYSTGFGRVNAYKAVKAIADHRFMKDSVGELKQKKHRISVPEGVGELKVLLCWTDPPAEVNAAIALVHDLDLKVEPSDGSVTYLPWILDPTANATSLSTPARRGRDTLNNAEQVSIANPPAGEYEIVVTANKLTTELQEYALTYELQERNYFKWIMPVAGDKLVAGTSQVLRFETDLSIADAKVEINLDGTWLLVSEEVDVVGNTVTSDLPVYNGPAILRLAAEGNSYYSDTFYIGTMPNLQVGFVCADSALVYWNSGNGDEFIVYRLGDFYMEELSRTTDTSIVVKLTQLPGNVISVASASAQGRTGIRSFGIDVLNQGVECYFKSFLADWLDNKTSNLTIALGSDFNLDSLFIEKKSRTGFRTIASFKVNSLSFESRDNSLEKGLNTYRLKLLTRSGAVIYSAEETVYSIGETEVILYPNPVNQNNDLYILTRDTDGVEVEFMDVTGRILLRKKVVNQLERISTVHFPKGIILYRLIRNKVIESVGRIVVQ